MEIVTDSLGPRLPIKVYTYKLLDGLYLPETHPYSPADVDLPSHHYQQSDCVDEGGVVKRVFTTHCDAS